MRVLILHSASAGSVVSGELSLDLHAAHDLKRRIDAGGIEDGDQVRGIYQRHRAGLDTPKTVLSALAVLKSRDVAPVECQGAAGRPTDVIRIIGQSE